MLSTKHLEELHNSAISDEVIQERGYYSEDDTGKVKALGFANYQARAGLVIPIWTTDGQNGSCVVKPYNPRCIEQKNKPKEPDGSYKQKIYKYETPENSGIRLDCPPRCRPGLGDPKIPLWITEGVKKGDALASAGLCAIDLGGVWGFKGKNINGGVTLLADWDLITFKGREVNIAYDSDVMTKREVQTAFDRLKTHLSRRGAVVQAVYLPPSPNGKMGVDDFLAAGHTLDELKAMVTLPRSSPIQPKATSEDYYRELNRLGWFFRLNILTDVPEVNGRPVTDMEDAVILTTLRDLGFTNIAGIRDAITALAFQNAYHPIKNYFDGLPLWDGNPYIENLAAYFKTTDPNFSTWLKRWLIGAVRRVRERGEQNRVLVLSGPQNIGKSKFVRWLCPDKLINYFQASPIYPDIKDQKLALMSKWIWEVAELGNTTRKADREALKFFISLEQVSERFPYGRRPVTKPVLTSFIGTLNDEGGVLTDPTGSRRFMFTKIDAIDWRYTQNLSPDLIWAEAVYRYTQGENADLTPGEEAAAEKSNAEFDAENPVEGILLEYFNVDPEKHFIDWWTPTKNIVSVLQNPYKGAYHGTSDQLTKNIASVLTGLKCKKVRKTSWWNPGQPIEMKFSSQVIGYEGVIEKV